ncbi:hypothetical protein B4902_00825 [Yersinia frederiksenii]|nr:hypothetical protein B4902_00825 [Yersinia frederiksenii]
MLTAKTLITGWNGSDGLKASAIFWRDNTRSGPLAGRILQKPYKLDLLSAFHDGLHAFRMKILTQ